ncbi:hypothetical protein SNEBB_003280 [Seison nebaliae]|nr:hypothetical protein SNEBB_003280 [Seison nebaliae]
MESTTTNPEYTDENRDVYLEEINWINSIELYNLVMREDGNGIPLFWHENYLLLIDCRPKQYYDNMHLFGARNIYRKPDGTYFCNIHNLLQCAKTIILYDSGDDSEASKNLAVNCFKWLSSEWDTANISLLLNGIQDITRMAPFLCEEQSMLVPIRERRLIKTYPFIITDSIMLGTRAQANDNYIMENIPVDAYLNLTTHVMPKFSTNTSSVDYFSLYVNPYLIKDDFLVDLSRIFDFMHTVLYGREQRLLVYSEHGENTGTILIIYYLMKTRNWSVKKGLDLIKKQAFVFPPTNYLYLLANLGRAFKEPVADDEKWEFSVYGAIPSQVKLEKFADVSPSKLMEPMAISSS